MFDVCRIADSYIAVIDIGSNSVRLVVFSGRDRVPDTIFNEKVMCGLGAEVGTTGKMSETAITTALSTLKRYCLLCEQMNVSEIQVLATAAVRDADNGQAFVKLVKKSCGLDIKVIEGEEEGRLSALGVLSGEPTATGIMGDLGGGSLELARIKNGKVHETISMPLGPLRLRSKFGDDKRKIAYYLRDLFSSISWLEKCEGQTLYLVGGAWRNIAKLMIREKSHPLPILHGFSNAKNEFASYCKRISYFDPSNIPFANDLPSRRKGVLPVAAIVMKELLGVMKAKSVTVSSFGLREGYIFDGLSDDIRKLDPYLFSCHVLADERARFAEHAQLIYDWTRPLFTTKPHNENQHTRLHQAICLLSDIAWRGHPDFRAEKAVEMALHGNFVGLTHNDRAYVAVALNQTYGAPIDTPQISSTLPLLKIQDIMDAQIMGAGIRLAQRLSGGTALGLTHTGLRKSKGKLYLQVPKSYENLVGEVVMKRLEQLAQLVGRKSAIEFTD